MKTPHNLHRVAAEAKVSTSTASRVLAGGKARELCSAAAIQRVEAAASKLGYRVNYHMRAVRNGRSNLIGFSLQIADAKRSNQVGAWYFDQISGGLESACQQNGKSLLVIRPDEARQALERGIDYLRDRRLDGLVLIRNYAERGLALLDERDPDRCLNIVSVDGTSGFGYPHVGFNTEGGLELIARHLLEFGHQRVLWFGPRQKVKIESEEREQSFLRAAFSAGLGGEVLLVDVDTSQSETIHDNLARLEAQFREGFSPFKMTGLTGVVCYNDIYALAAQRSLLALGLRIPQDISLAGFDDSWSVFGNPPITTVNHMLFEIGHRAGQVAIDRFHGELADTCPPLIEPRLVPRASTGPRAA